MDTKSEIENGEMKTSRDPHLRKLRRASSFTVATANREDKKQRVFQDDDPCHEPRDSLFSSTSGYTNYRGFLNLALIMLVSLFNSTFNTIFNHTLKNYLIFQPSGAFN
jgi:hypothetical protein